MSKIWNFIKGANPLSAITGLFGNLMTNRANRKIAESTNAANIQMQNAANQTNLDIMRETNEANWRLNEANNRANIEMWEREMAYNTPEQQMARLKEAGVNPITAYGNMSNTAPSAPTLNSIRQEAAQVNAPQNQPYTVNYDNMAQVMQQSISQAANIQQNIAQNQLLREQIKGQEIQNELNEQLLPNIVLKGIKELENMGLNTLQLKESLINMKQDGISKRLQNQLDQYTIKDKIKQMELQTKNYAIKNKLETTAYQLNKIELKYKEAITKGNVKLQKEQIKIAKQQLINLKKDIEYKMKTMNSRVEREQLQNDIMYLNEAIRDTEKFLLNKEADLYEGTGGSILKATEKIGKFFK